MTIIPRDMPDLLKDAMVAALQAFSDEQAAIDPAVAFAVTRDQGRPFQAVDMPKVNVWLDELRTSEESSARTSQHEVAVIQVDCYARGLEGAQPSDEEAALRLDYLREQAKYGLYRLINSDFGFAAGVIARKRWPRWRTFQTEAKMPEDQVVAGRWTVEVEYSWTPEDIAAVDLSEILVSESTRDAWSARYTYP